MKLYSLTEVDQLSHKEVRKLYKAHVNPGLEDILYSFAAGDELVEHSEGVWITLKSGRKLLDASGGIGVLNHGHNHPRLLEARRRFIEKKRMEVHKLIFSPYMAALSHNLAQILPGDLDYPYFCNSGAEAVEGAMKLAYKVHNGERAHILHADISFHGKLLGSGGMTNVTEKGFRFLTIPGIREYQYNDLDSVRSLVKELRQSNGESDVYAIIVEAFNAITITQAKPEFLKGLRRICDEEGISLICDEVFVGWCKTGNYFNFMDAEIVPDFVTTSKSLGGGKSSISAYVTRKPLLIKAYGDVATATLHSTTYNGFGEECITALEAINIMVEDDYVTKSRAIEKLAFARGEQLREKFPNQILDIRGAGALHGIFPRIEDGFLGNLIEKLPLQIMKEGDFLKKLTVAAMVDHLFREHDIFSFFNNSKDVGLLFSPPIIIEPEQTNAYYDALEKTFERGIFKLTAAFVKNKVLKMVT